MHVVFSRTTIQEFWFTRGEIVQEFSLEATIDKHVRNL